MAHPALTVAREGTPQNFALRKGGTEQYMATKMPILYVNLQVISIKINSPLYTVLCRPNSINWEW
jgi:hypothetical protein